MPFVPAPRPCWLILAEGDWLGCGRCWGRAVWLAERIWADELAAGAQPEGPPVIRRAEGLCVQVRCSGCGVWWADEETGAPLHQPFLVDLWKACGEDGWVGDWCPACQRAELMP